MKQSKKLCEKRFIKSVNISCSIHNVLQNLSSYSKTQTGKSMPKNYNFIPGEFNVYILTPD